MTAQTILVWIMAACLGLMLAWIIMAVLVGSRELTGFILQEYRRHRKRGKPQNLGGVEPEQGE